MLTLLSEANAEADEARTRRTKDFWYWRCRAAGVEWVLNVLSAVRVSQGFEPTIPPTACSFRKAVDLLNERRAA